jgi:hypothetical protein
MPNIKKVNAGGKEFDAIERDFEVTSEQWNEYKLLDGGSIRLKTTITRIYVLVDDQGKVIYNPDGEPQVMVKHKSDIIANL